MEREITLRVVVRKPPAGVDIGVQEGHGNDYKTVQTQRSTAQDLQFEFPVRVKENKAGGPNFLGPFAQGPADKRFVYLDIGACAGQTNTPWSRRLKIPLAGITWPLIEQASKASRAIEVCVPGTGGDGGPTCGTVKEIISGWAVSKK
jgi:hypothetical protein